MKILKYFLRKQTQDTETTSTPESSDNLKQILEERRRMQRDLTDYRGALWEIRNPSSQYTTTLGINY